MAKYPIKMLLDELQRPFFPLVTIDTIVTNNSDKTLRQLFEDRYTKAEVDKLISDLGTLQRLRGTVNSYEELLAIENPMPGDTYILLVESGNNSEYMYIGDKWELLGPMASYTDIYNKEVIDEMLLTLKQELNTKTESDDAEVLAQAKLYAEDLFADVPVPNLDDYYKKSENAYFQNGVRMYNHNTQSDGRKIDLLVEHIQGVGYGGYEDDLYLNHRSSNNVHILENGTGTLYYKGNEVADRYYVDEQIENIEEYQLPKASSSTLGGIKVGANLTIDAEGVLSATGGSGENTGETIGEVMPIGTMVPYASANNVPANWRICDGSEVSRTTYAALFNVIGTSYGEGDGETTFNLPDKRGRVSVGLDEYQDEFNSVGLKGGEKKHALTIDEMPSHNHELRGATTSGAKAEGVAFGNDSTPDYVNGQPVNANGGNQSHNNLQPYEVDVWIIKVSNVIGTLETENANVIDNLTSTSSTDVLSANMGRELHELITSSKPKNEKILFQSEEGTTETITLTNDYQDFELIKVYGARVGGFSAYTEFSPDYGNICSLRVDNYNSSSLTNYATTLTFASNEVQMTGGAVALWASNGTVAGVANVAEVKVRKIVGVYGE